MATSAQMKAAQDKAEDDFITITGPDEAHLESESLKADNECIKLIKEISKMPKLKDCPFCGNEADINMSERSKTYYLSCMGAECGATGPERISMDEAIVAWNERDQISATKTTQEPKMYFAWNREDARRLIGMNVDCHDGSVGDEWTTHQLEGISDECAAFSVVGDFPFKIIREIPKIQMTLAEAMAKYVPDNIEIVE